MTTTRDLDAIERRWKYPRERDDPTACEDFLTLLTFARAQQQRIAELEAELAVLKEKAEDYGFMDKRA